MNDTLVIKKMLVPLIFVTLAYEWLVSGIDKIISGSFVSHMHKQFIQAIPDMQYHFYANIVKSLFAHFSSLIAWAVEFGELFAGISFLFLAIWIFRNHLKTSGMVLGMAAGIVSAFMNLNFFFYQGGSFFVNSSDPFDEGIPVDLVMFFMESAIAVACFLMIRANRQVSERN